MPAAKSTTKADKKAYDAEWRKSPSGRQKAKANSIRYRNSAQGRESIKAQSDRRSEKRRQIAAAKAGIAVTKPGEFDASSVQRALNVWGG